VKEYSIWTRLAFRQYKKPAKAITRRGQKQVGKITSAARGRTITAVCTMNPSGNFLLPVFLFAPKRMVESLRNGEPSGSLGLVTSNGWMDSETLVKWLQHFQKYVSSSNERKILLIFDNHSSHISVASAEYVRLYDIALLSSPHTSHKLQPLDRKFFGPLKTS